MRRRLVILLGFALVLFALAPTVMAGHGNGNGAHVASLSGEEEVGPVETDAAGHAVIKFRGDNESLSYVLVVTNIENVVAAHIHCGVAGVNGPVGVTLFTGGPTSDSGVLAKATVTETDVNSPTDDPVENACGWDTIADVAAAIESENAYVNVHTNDGVEPPNTGPGDFPGGEIRGQIR